MILEAVVHEFLLLEHGGLAHILLSPLALQVLVVRDKDAQGAVSVDSYNLVAGMLEALLILSGLLELVKTGDLHLRDKGSVVLGH